jgi:hypothetical protein
MAETILSPGVYINENDQSFVTQGVVSTGAVIVGPTNKGPAFVPTVVRSTSEFQNRFGNSLQYNKTVTYVPQTVDAYLNQAGSVMVVRVLGGGGFSFGSSRKLAALVVSGSDEVLTVLYPSLNPVYPQGLSASLWDGNANDDTNAVSITGSYVLTLGGTEFPTTTLSASINTNSPNYVLNVLGNQPNNVVGLASSSFAYINFRQRQSATDLTSSMIYLVTSSATIDFTSSVAEGYDHGRTPWITSGNSGKQLFKFHHRGDGFDTNTDVYVSITNLVEPADVNGVAQYSTFTVLVRKVGDDDVTPIILESYTGCNLNPQSPSFLGRKIGDRYEEYNVSLNKVVTNGDYANISQFIRVEIAEDIKAGALSPKLSPRGHENYYDVGGFASTYKLPSASFQTQKVYNGFYNNNVFLGFDTTNPDNFNYLKPVPEVGGVIQAGNNVAFNVDTLFGHPSSSYTGSLSASVNIAGAGGPTGRQLQFNVIMQFGSDGIDYQKWRYVGDKISSDGKNVFGLDLSSTSTAGGQAYKKATDILSNKDRYDFNIISTPGVLSSIHGGVTNQTLNMVEERADAIYVMDLTEINDAVSTAASQTSGLDSSYAAVYYPWVQMINIDNGAPEYFTPSVVIPSVYQRNDNIAAPWFAPAGLTRGGIPGVIQAKNPLTKTERDILYQSRVNPIATFPNQGVTVFGQKTLQRAASALDRVNVRRLLINLKKFVDAQSRFLVFEQNTSATRQRFLNLVNPYLQSIQDRQGVYAYRVQMDDSNNTPDVIDRNELVGAIYIQPTKTAEFIMIDFNIQATGAQI